MAARYKRALSQDILDALMPRGNFRFLLPDLPSDDRHALDIQLREKDTLMYYHGTTSLLKIKLKATGGKINVKATADKSYCRCPEYNGLMRLWPQTEKDKLQKTFSDYLRSAIGVANPKCYRDETAEGKWQNRLCINRGRRGLPNVKYMIIDRECVIGFDKKPEKEKYDSLVLKPYGDIRERLQTNLPDTFGKARKKSFGDNLDMLALDKQGNLVVIELKHGSNSTGIYWAPLQVLAYRDAFKGKLAKISRDIKKLVKQKVALELLPRAALSRLPQGRFPTVKAVLAIAEPNPKSKCWGKFNRVILETKVSRSIDYRANLRIITLE